MLDPEGDDITQQQAPYYSHHLNGGLRSRWSRELPPYNRRYRYRGLSSPYVNPDTMPTVPEGADYEDDYRGDGEALGGAESQSELGSVVEAPGKSEKHLDNNNQMSDTLVTWVY